MIHLKKAVPWQREVLKQLHALFTQIIDKPFGYELEAYSALLHIWKQLLENLEEKPAEERPFMERGEAHELLSYLKDHYRDNLTLDQVARHMHLSRSECCSMFRATYDTTIFSFLTDYRLQQSILLLTDSAYSVSRIAEEVGFQSTSYYIKLFREKTGQTPLRYRRIAQAEKEQGTSGPASQTLGSAEQRSAEDDVRPRRYAL